MYHVIFLLCILDANTLTFVWLSSPQSHTVMGNKLPFIIEAHGVEHGDDLRHPQHRNTPPRQGEGSPVHRCRLSTLPGNELGLSNTHHISRSPVQSNAGRSLSPQPFTNEGFSPSPLSSLNRDHSMKHQPAKLLMPSVSCVSPLNLSPRWPMHPALIQHQPVTTLHLFITMQRWFVSLIGLWMGLRTMVTHFSLMWSRARLWPV